MLNSIVEANRDNPKKATNSPKFCYSITDELLGIVKCYKTEKWEIKLKLYNENVRSFITKYKKKREVNMVSIKIDGEKLKLGPGKYNQLQKAIIEEFAPRFAKGAELLYVGDTENKDLIKKVDVLENIGVSITEHDKLPDVIFYLENKKWLHFIEAVTLVEPMNDKTIIQIKEMTKNCKCSNVYVTAFLNKSTFKKFVSELAWETEVWLSEQPDHMIHLNGDRFMGPR